MALKGLVKWFSKDKGFGFAEVEGIEGDVMLHQSAIEMEGFRYLKAKQEILVDGTEVTDNGVRAVKIQLIAKA
jgi:CspA family cold shock protein